MDKLLSLSSSDSEDYELDEVPRSMPIQLQTRLIEVPTFSPRSSQKHPFASELDKISKQLQRTREELNEAKKRLGGGKHFVSSRLTNYDETDEVFELIQPKAEEVESKKLTRVSSLMTFGVPSMCTSPKGEEKRDQVIKVTAALLSVSRESSISITENTKNSRTFLKQVCSCMLKLSLKDHNKNCRPIACYDLQNKDVRRRNLSLVEAVKAIQKAYRKYLKKKNSYSYTKTSQSPLLTPTNLTPELPETRPATDTQKQRVPYRTMSTSAFRLQQNVPERPGKRNMTLSPNKQSRLSEAAKVYMSRTNKPMKLNSS